MNLKSFKKNALQNFRKDLTQHFQTLKQFLRAKAMVSNSMLKGHMEAHLEEVDSMMFELNEIVKTEQQLQPRTQTQPQQVTELQAMKFMHSNLKKLNHKVRSLLSRNRQQMDAKTEGVCREMLRKLSNDQWRTGYFLQ